MYLFTGSDVALGPSVVQVSEYRHVYLRFRIFQSLINTINGNAKLKSTRASFRDLHAEESVLD